MPINFLIDFIIPFYDDIRIFKCVTSILRHKHSVKFRIILIAGNPKSKYLPQIKKSLRASDLLFIGLDKGIFDALNIGLKNTNAEWIGWLGSDDYLSENFDISYLEDAKSDYSFIYYSTAIFRIDRIIRLYSPVSSPFLRKIGFHTPHFSSFIRKKSLNNLYFDLSYPVYSDIFFFLEFEKNHNGIVVKNISTFMAAGGNSNKNIKNIMINNLNLFFDLYKKYNFLYALIFILNKFVYKIFQRFIVVFLNPKMNSFN
jgi:hypothetical protein